ncbi:MAG: phosphatidate cytidylyltransferase [Bacteroidota bacterium]
MNDLGKRFITGVIGAGIIVAAILFSYYGMWLFCFIVSSLSLWEFLRISGVKAVPYQVGVLAFSTFIWLGILYSLTKEITDPLPFLIIIPALIFLSPILQILTLFNNEEPLPLESLGRMIFGVVYCYIPFLLFYFFSVPSVEAYNPRVPLGILFLNFGLDTGAYFAGKFLGKRALFSRVSPNKTWEGWAGGILLCFITSFFFQLYIPVSGVHWMAIAAILSVFAPLGDLVESLLKRNMNLKDSGSILPGHGGMLDRFDGLFMALPFIYFYLSCC